MIDVSEILDWLKSEDGRKMEDYCLSRFGSNIYTYDRIESYYHYREITKRGWVEQEDQMYKKVEKTIKGEGNSIQQREKDVLDKILFIEVGLNKLIREIRYGGVIDLLNKEREKTYLLVYMV